jgi:hypothetical protein
MKTTVHSAQVKTVARRIAERLQGASSDELVTHDELRALVPAALRPLYYMLISKARRLVNEESGIILATVTKEGYRRLPPDIGVEHAGTHPMHRIRRTARRAGRSLTNSVRHANDLQPAQRRRAHQNLTVFGLVEHLTNRRTINTIPEDPPPEADPLSGLRRIIGGAR